ncbi:NAD(P)-binding domain-containing protein [Streptomyces sp. HU2014]|uniref:6-phosphogluconate dehydrogenase n=1 Tax=Streptomyces albireticuli TaxID=1940 RepID=A0A1Z2L0I4_9ACTN|nr:MULTISPECIES: NAD(P)-binding domain-containing protein [Streptomyces]ARZ67804.1 6-phosphogluconate dehydrogenase [Streptomyces albireticuli]UQI47802.1 NAD(P)-binding domain-containing protein [Streptomyces sp. HU2014]
MSSNSPVSVLGLGAMGKALATAFLTGGHPTTVWNRTPGKADPLVALGAARAADVTAAVTASELVVVCLLDDASVHETLDPVAAELAGRTLVNLTNGTPAQARATAGWAAAHGIAYVDGGIMAVPPGIGTDQAFVLYSGAEDAFAAHRPALERLGAARFVGADAGLAALYDIALLSGMYGMFAGVFHALALVGTEQVPAAEFAPLLTGWIGAMATAIPHMAEQAESGDYTDGVVSNAAMQAAAFGNLLRTAEDQGVSGELIAPLRPLLDRLVAEGGGAGDVTGIVGLLTKPA